jgi:guanylate kinase
MNPVLLVLSAPTGGGKTTIAHRLAEQDGRLRFSVSHTTRKARPSERDSEDYHFVGEEEFRAMAERGEFLEWAQVHGHLYGTHRSELEAAASLGRDLLLDIDVQGGLQVKRAAPEAVLVFIRPPSLSVLLERLGKRAFEEGFDLRRRLETALKELEMAGSYDYNLVNEDLTRAVIQVQSILEAARVRAADPVEGTLALKREIAAWLRSSDVHGQ